MQKSSRARIFVFAWSLLAAGCGDGEYVMPSDDVRFVLDDAELAPDDVLEDYDAETAGDAERRSDVVPGLDAEIEPLPTPDAGPIATIDASPPVTRPDAAVMPPPPPMCMPRTYRLRHLQASQQRTDPVAQRNGSIDAAFAVGAHTICWTEIENASDANRIHARAGWNTYWASGRPEVVARNAVPLSWRQDTFRFVRANAWQASEGRMEVSPSRWVVRVWLQHILSGGVISRVCHHSVSGVDGDGVAPVAWRRARHAENIAEFRRVMNLDDVPVIGSADFNTTRLRALMGSGFAYDVPSSGGSHGGRLIDWIVRRPHPQHRFVDVRFVTLGTSDHRGVYAGYNYTPPCR